MTPKRLLTAVLLLLASTTVSTLFSLALWAFIKLPAIFAPFCLLFGLLTMITFFWMPFSMFYWADRNELGERLDKTYDIVAKAFTKTANEQA